MNFRNLLTVFRREMAAYFNAAIAYIFIIVFVLLTGGLFMTQFFLLGRADMRPFFAILPFILAVFIPAVTMRQWAEERRGNTLELLLTFPMRTHEVVAGKYLAGLLFYGAALLCTLPVPIMLNFLGNPDMGPIIGGYLGSLCLGSLYLAIGIFVSGLCRDQIVAFILSMIICFGLHLTGTEFIASSIDGWLPGLGSLLRHFVGSAEHFDVFAKGILATGHFLYFVIGTVIFLVLNGFWLEGRMRPKSKQVFATAVVIAAGIFLTSNWLLAGVSLGRFDLTENKVHTVSEASKQILKELKAPVVVKFYVSPVEKMPTGMKSIEQEVVDKLDELRVNSGGNFQYKIFHMEAANVVEGQAPSDDEPLEKQLQRKGIEPFQVRAIVSDEVAVRLVYSSLAISYKEKPDEIIPRVVPDNLRELEYNLLSKIYRLTLPEIPKIALVAPYEEKQVEPQLKELLAQLGGQIPDGYREDQYELLEMSLNYDGYDVSRIQLTEEEPIPDGTTTLVVVEPKELNERQLYEINKFVRGGGSLFLSVHNYDYNYQPQGRELAILPEAKKPEINTLLKKWGFEVDEQILVDQQHDVINLSGARMGPFAMNIPVKVPIQVLVTESGMNDKLSITSSLSSLFYLWGTALKIDQPKVDGQGLEVKELLSSSPQSWTVPFKSGQIKGTDLEPNSNGRTGPFSLALLVEGQFADAYEGQDVPEWPKEETEEPTEDGAEAEENEAEETAADEVEAGAISVNPAPGKMVLIGASSLFQKHLVQGGGNLDFFMNSVDALTLGDELVTIRSKKVEDRNIGRIPSSAKVGWRLFVSVVVPVMIAIIGALRVFLRKKTKQRYLKQLAEAEA